MKHIALLAAAALLLAPLAPAASAPAEPKILAANVFSEVEMLAGPALRGRGSATSDEAIAAGYVASLFRGFGLRPAPGMDGFLQTAPVIRKKLSGDPVLTVDGKALAGAAVLTTSGGIITGKAVIVRDPAAPIATTDVLIYTGPAAGVTPVRRAASRAKVKLLLIAESAETRSFMAAIAGRPMLPTGLAGMPERRGLSIAALPAAALGTIGAGQTVTLDVPVAIEQGVTTNAIGYLPGTDPKAGVILLTAHLDHLGVRPDGVVMPGANDDASGTVAVLELARTFAGKRMKRGILFVAYGSEEIGGLGSTWFGEHPPVPLTDVVTNIEFEMIGAQDPKLPKGALMMTGSERSTLFELMKTQGAAIAADPYPDMNFFARSDNYSLALKGIVAHTFSGWAVVPTYHQPTDTIANLDIPFMTAAIQSLIAPIRLLATSDVRPAWKAGGQPK